MKLVYIANARIPTEKAHGIQIMKACEAFARAGHDTMLVLPERANPIPDDPFTYYGVQRLFRITHRWTLDLVSWGRIGFFIQACSFACAARWSMPEHDIVYGRDEIVLAVLSMLGVRRIVWESHDGAWNIWARFLTPRLHRLVVVSEGARVAYVARGIPAARILAVPNGIDVGSFASAESREAARIRLGLSADARVAMYVGRLDGWKGVDTFLESAAFLPVGVEAVVIGGDPAQVEERLRQYPSVRFIGYRPYRELPDNQSAADILVVPNTAKDIVSVRYTSPLKLFAHMASGRPVVASDLPSIREIAGDTVAYVIPDDPKALAEAIGATLLDPVTAHARARRAMERVHRYSWDARAVTIGSFLG